MSCNSVLIFIGTVSIGRSIVRFKFNLMSGLSDQPLSSNIS
jgi:hypothetical protein